MNLFQKLRGNTTLRLHGWLGGKIGSYRAWHNNPSYKQIHSVVLVLLVLILTPVAISSFKEFKSLPKLFAFNVINAQGGLINGQMELVDEGSDEVLGEAASLNQTATVAASVDGKKYKLKFVPANGLLTSLEYDDVELEKNPNKKDKGEGAPAESQDSLDADVSVELDEPATPAGWDKVLAIGEVKGFNFSKGRYKKIAQGKDLFKCLDWDFANQKCNGRWKKIAKLTPGQEYTVEFAPGDPGYGEKSNAVYILNKNKYLANYTETTSANSSNSAKLDVQVTLQEAASSTSTTTVVSSEETVSIPSTLHNIEVSALDPALSSNEIILSSLQSDPITQSSFVVDTSNLASEEVKIHEKAAGSILLSCANYDDANSACQKWKKEKNIVKDEDYVVILSSPGRSVFGQSKDGVVVLDKDLQVLAGSSQSQKVEGSNEISVQLTDLNPNKITTYFNASDTASGEIVLDTGATSTTTDKGKVLSIDLSQTQVVGADIEGTAEGWDMFKCSDFDLANQVCKGKYKKIKDLVSGGKYLFNIKNEEKTQGFLESKKKVSLLNAGNELLTYTETETTAEDNKMVVEIVPQEENNPIRKIKVKNPDPAQGNDLKISPTVIADRTFLQGYAIDPTQIKADSLELEVEAKANTLYKCKDWDFAQNTCLGTWEKYKDLNVGEIYSLPIDSQDPGFMEVDEQSSSSAPAPALAASSTGGGGSLPEASPTVASVSGGGASSPKTAAPITEEKAVTEAASSVQSFPGTSSSPEKNVVLNNNYTVTVPPAKEFKQNLSYGVAGEDVKSLQKFLNKNGFLVAKTGAGSPGKETNYFGPLTRQALNRFQEAHADKILESAGLTKPTGILGPQTREFINSFTKI